MRRKLMLLTALAIAAGCHPAPGSFPAAMTPAGTSVQEIPRINGHVDFPERAIASTTSDLVTRATVSVIDSTNQTVAVTLTDADGKFSLSVAGFTPAAGSFYTLEAIKGLSAAASGGAAIRMRTIVQWTGAGWNSCTGADAVAITPTTTAVAIVKATQAGVGFPETLGAVSAAEVVSTNATLNTHWQKVRNLVNSLLVKDIDPIARITLSAGTYSAFPDKANLIRPNLASGTFSSTNLMLDGSLQLTGALPRPKVEDEVSFAASGASTVGVVAMDGNYVYVRPWAAKTGWIKIGTGYNGTTQGAYGGGYNITSEVLNAGFYGGYLYQVLHGAGNNGMLERVNVSTGATSSVALGAPALFRETGLTDVGTWANMISDGNYLYNWTWTILNRGFNGFTLRVFDPTNSFALVRQMDLDGANTPLVGTSYGQGGMVDGVYFYANEWAYSAPRNGRARMRRYRLSDGQLEAETTYFQDYPTDDPLTGCYDWINNKFWFGNYQSNVIHRTAGRAFPASGTWLSPPIDLGSTAPLLGRLNFNAVATGGQVVKFDLRSSDTRDGLSGAFSGPNGTTSHYTASGTPVNPIHNRQRWLQIRATLEPNTTGTTASGTPAANTTPRLYGVSVEVIP